MYARHFFGVLRNDTCKVMKGTNCAEKEKYNAIPYRYELILLGDSITRMFSRVVSNGDKVVSFGLLIVCRLPLGKDYSSSQQRAMLREGLSSTPFVATFLAARRISGKGSSGSLQNLLQFIPHAA